MPPVEFTNSRVQSISSSADRVAAIAGGIITLLGLVVIIGWYARIPAIVQLHPTLVPMQFNTALCFTLCGIALIGLSRTYIGTTRVCSAISFTIALLTVVEYLTSVDIGLDQLFITHYITTHTSLPGRMASTTAVSFALMSFVLFASTLSWRNNEIYLLLNGLFCSVVGAFSGAAIVAYWFDMASLVNLKNSTEMALHTAFGHLLMSVATLHWVARTRQRNEQDIYRLAGFSVFGVIVMLSVVLFNALQRVEIAQQQQYLESEARWVANSLNTLLDVRRAAMQRMSRRWNTEGGTHFNIWQKDAEAYVIDMPGIRAIEWMDNEGIIRWVVPLEGNEKILNTAPNRDPVRRHALDLARNERREAIAGPIELIQGGTGLLIFNPVFKKELSDGFVVAVLRIDDLLVELLKQNPRTYTAAISLKVDEKSSGSSSEKITLPIHLGESSMLLQLNRNNEKLSKTSTLLPPITLVGGLIIAVLFLAMFSFWRTTARQAEEVRRINARNKSLLSALPDQLFQLNEFGGIVNFQNNAADELAIPNHDLIGARLVDLVPADVSKSLDEHINAARRTDTIQIFECALPDAGDVLQDFEIRISPIPTGGVLALFRNISEQKRIDRMKHEFISTVSHELRTPLTSISGALGLIAGNAFGDIAPDMREVVEIAQRNSERLTNLINDILDIEKIEQGQLPLLLQKINLTEIVIQSIAEIAVYARKMEVTLNNKFQQSEAFIVDADSFRLKQVLANLISNAAKFSQPGGAVDISISRRDDIVRVGIRDYGVGIPETFRSQIFKKFSQADSSDTRRRGGTGLGLAISRAIINQMNGTIDFVSHDNGTEFYFELPIFNPSTI